MKTFTKQLAFWTFVFLVVTFIAAIAARPVFDAMKEIW